MVEGLARRKRSRKSCSDSTVRATDRATSRVDSPSKEAIGRFSSCSTGVTNRSQSLPRSPNAPTLPHGDYLPAQANARRRPRRSQERRVERRRVMGDRRACAFRRDVRGHRGDRGGTRTRGDDGAGSHGATTRDRWFRLRSSTVRGPPSASNRVMTGASAPVFVSGR